MTLQGRKSDGTDLHSKSAAILGISRDHAKVFNYGRIYGAGESYAMQLLRQFNKEMSEEVAKRRASDLYRSTKGVRQYCLPDGRVLSKDEYNVELQRLTKGRRMGYARARKQLNATSVWVGGSESYMFNRLEAIATSPEPRTPALGCAISDALHPDHVRQEVRGRVQRVQATLYACWVGTLTAPRHNDDVGWHAPLARAAAAVVCGCAAAQYMTSRINWVVQSSGVDYLHLLLVSMRWLQQQYNLAVRAGLAASDPGRALRCSDDVRAEVEALRPAVMPVDRGRGSPSRSTTKCGTSRRKSRRWP